MKSTLISVTHLRDVVLLLIYCLGEQLCVWENGFSMYKVTYKVIQNLTNLFKHKPIEANKPTTTK